MIIYANITYVLEIDLIKLSFENISYVQESCFSVIKMISSHDFLLKNLILFFKKV